MSGPVAGADGRPRCPWGASTADYVDYHDTEWGRPVADDRGLYERLVLEAFQSGLSWLTILRKRPAFRRAFDDFVPERVARYGAPEMERLLGDAGIVRNRAKIEAAIRNADAVRGLVADGPGLAAVVWSYAPEGAAGDPPRAAPRTLTEVPAHTDASRALAKELKRRGLVFVGPTTSYALMQAVGVVNDHLAGCWVRDVCAAERVPVVARLAATAEGH